MMLFAECDLCQVQFMLIAIHAEGNSRQVQFMKSVSNKLIIVSWPQFIY
jgi:hypothetical protein